MALLRAALAASARRGARGHFAFPSGALPGLALRSAGADGPGGAKGLFGLAATAGGRADAWRGLHRAVPSFAAGDAMPPPPAPAASAAASTSASSSTSSGGSGSNGGSGSSGGSGSNGGSGSSGGSGGSGSSGSSGDIWYLLGFSFPFLWHLVYLYVKRWGSVASGHAAS